MFFKKKQFTVWVIADTCWVVEKPRTDVEIVGIILPGSAVYVEKAKKRWLRIVNGPVRNPEDGLHIDPARFKMFIQEKDVSRTMPAGMKEIMGKVAASGVVSKSGSMDAVVNKKA